MHQRMDLPSTYHVRTHLTKYPQHRRSTHPHPHSHHTHPHPHHTHKHRSPHLHQLNHHIDKTTKHHLMYSHQIPYQLKHHAGGKHPAKHNTQIHHLNTKHTPINKENPQIYPQQPIKQTHSNKVNNLTILQININGILKNRLTERIKEGVGSETTSYSPS